jgi:hypothetical protein
MKIELTNWEKKREDEIIHEAVSKKVYCANCCRELPERQYDPNIPAALQYFYCDDCAAYEE